LAFHISFQAKKTDHGGSKKFDKPFIDRYIGILFKNATLYENYWETREAGAYKFTEAKADIYLNGEFVRDSSIAIGNSYILLYTTMVDGFYNDLKLFGDWTPPVFQNKPFEKAWNMENDNKRITFSAYDESGFYFPTSTLTIDNVGDKKQKWHYIISNGNSYTHITISVERTTNP
jgi:hypothetical protein